VLLIYIIINFRTYKISQNTSKLVTIYKVNKIKKSNNYFPPILWFNRHLYLALGINSRIRTSLWELRQPIWLGCHIRLICMNHSEFSSRASSSGARLNYNSDMVAFQNRCNNFLFQKSGTKDWPMEVWLISVYINRTWTKRKQAQQ
jgi:hypothetical protein